MTSAALLVVTIFVLVVLAVLAQPRQGSARFGFWIGLARLLRRIGRWFWALGEGIEFGYQHSRSVKQRIALDLGAAPEVREQPPCPMNN